MSLPIIPSVTDDLVEFLVGEKYRENQSSQDKNVIIPHSSRPERSRRRSLRVFKPSFDRLLPHIHNSSDFSIVIPVLHDDVITTVIITKFKLIVENKRF